jgi:glycosyltransferase involved in cell wall biosynthesis
VQLPRLNAPQSVVQLDGSTELRHTPSVRDSGSTPKPNGAGRLRVLRLVPVLDFGGVETEIAVQAALHDRSHFDLRVCTFWKAGRVAETIRREGIPVDALDVDPSVRNAKAPWALARYLRRTRPDILHASVPEADFHASLVGKLAGARRVIVDEAGMPARPPSRRLVFAALHRRVDAHLAVSDALRDYLAESEFVPRRRIRVIHSCGGREFFEHPKDDYEVARPRFRVVSVGRLVDVKNKGVLVEAMGHLVKQGANVELVLLGDGPLRASLEARVAELGIGDRVQIAGFVPDLVSALRAADAYALPSHSEGCSLSLIEAMAMALPVIASRVPGNEEVLRGLDPSWLVPPEDAAGWAAAIARLAALSAGSRAGLGRSARDAASARFSPEAYVTALESMYARVYANVDPG